ncbi:hypothetical protein [Geomonas oryzae]|uniref:hypothetical protein n=1 Tax=Geomonas oryzae TaxID=2364273 RepID=UPI00100A6459|nr:hypothetical protein [Geomonas oryzae]
MIDFTDREMINAFRMHKRSSAQMPPSGTKRLVQFYAVECGLKALHMRNEGKRLTGECPYFSIVQHDIRALLGNLNFPPKLYSKIASTILSPINKKGKLIKREVAPRDYNQMWRYGAVSNEDEILEKELDAIIVKIEQDLR